MFETLLVPLDGSPFSEQALGPAEFIAECTGASLELIRVHVPQLAGETQERSWDDVLRQGARRYLDDAAKRVERLLHTSSPTTLLEGDVAERLCEHAAHHANALMVMATHGRTGLSRAWLGSVADGVVRRSPTPVLLVRVREKHHTVTRPRGSETLYERILVPLDGSPFSEQILEHVLDLGRAVGAHIHLLTAVEPLVTAESGFDVPVSIITEAPERYQQARRYIDDLVRRLEPQYVPNRITGEVRDRMAPAVAILDRARYMNADLIAFATHGRGLSRLLIGSVADKVLRGTDADVLTIRPMRD